MNEATLGRLEKVDLRTVWNNEAYDFTPWLAEEENLQLLGETIGIELELDGTEKNVGPFNADILCKDTVEDQWVLIENQLERTDHTHLGQLLTYAAGLHAVTVVWISAPFTEEHRAVMDWLNEITVEGINFFGLEIELWQIGGSPMAPKFNMVSKPNDWSDKVARATRSDGELTETKKLQLEYWTKLHELIEEQNPRIRPRSPKPKGWSVFAVGRSGCHLAARVNSRNHVIGVDLVLRREKEAEPLFHLLREEKEQIEAEIGQPLNWHLKPNTKRCLIDMEWHNMDPNDPSQWSRQHQLLAETLEKFHLAFSPRLKKLDISDYDPEPQEEPSDALP